jgi:hypothetical protein
MPKPLMASAEVMITTFYGKRPLRWIGDQLGCSAPTVLAYARRLGLSKPSSGKKGGRKPLVPVLERTILPIAPTVVSRDANVSLIRPLTREQLMAGSANVRRVYKVEA